VTPYSGALQPKKKAELQQIASALRISDQGTKEDLQNRIKSHLDQNQATLEEEPIFAGLFGRRKRSVQPPSSRFAQAAPAESSSDEKQSPPPVNRLPFIAARRVKALDPIREVTPINDSRDVSTMLKQPFSPNTTSTTKRSPRRQLGTPSSLPPLPLSPIFDVVPHADEVSLARRTQETFLRSGGDMLWNLRIFLSNSRNIWSLTALLELLYLIYTIIPWETVQLSPNTTSFKISLPYPPRTVFLTYAFWSVIGHWSISTLFIPALLGTIISFNPVQSRLRAQPAPAPNSRQPTFPRIPFDPLTASIIRLAAQIAYPYATDHSGAQIVDVLGFRWRALSAAVGVAFSFSEAIAEAPALYAKSYAPTADGHQIFGGKRALMAEETIVEIE
jgi:hypothetical protein